MESLPKTGVGARNARVGRTCEIIKAFQNEVNIHTYYIIESKLIGQFTFQFNKRIVQKTSFGYSSYLQSLLEEKKEEDKLADFKESNLINKTERMNDAAMVIQNKFRDYLTKRKSFLMQQNQC